MDQHTISAAGLTAGIKAEGAELCSLVTAEGIELLWQAHAAWPRHAPNLFPIVGTLKDDQDRLGGQTYRMGRHGFARDQRFAWEATSAVGCRLVMTENAATRAQYPFPFRFTIDYAIGEDGLTITFTIANTGDTVLPASMGGHPAFNWPLVPGVAKEAHSIVFSDPEPGPIRRVRPDGLLRAEALPSPVEGATLRLHDGLFVEDALIFDGHASRSLRYGAPGTPTVEFSWTNFPQLGIWTRPGVDLLCIEPWQGMSSPIDFDGEFGEKPGLLRIAPGGEAKAVHRIGLTRSADA